MGFGGKFKGTNHCSKIDKTGPPSYKKNLDQSYWVIFSATPADFKSNESLWIHHMSCFRGGAAWRVFGDR